MAIPGRSPLPNSESHCFPKVKRSSEETMQEWSLQQYVGMHTCVSVLGEEGGGGGRVVMGVS